MKNVTAVMFAIFLLSACGNTPAIVTDFNGDSVKVVTSGLEKIEYQKSVSEIEAQRICQTRGKRAEYASTIANNQTYQNEHLYLCL